MENKSTASFLDLRNRVISGKANEVERANFAAEVGHKEELNAVHLVGPLLDDENEIVRYNALSAMVLHLGQRGKEMETKCRRLWRDDPDDDVRRLALACLGSIYFGSYDLQFFEEVRDRLQQQNLERWQVDTAYTILFQIPGRHAREWPDRMGTREAMTYAEIDWEKVAELEAEVRAAAPSRVDR